MPRPLLWATTALLILALALAGMRVLTVRQEHAAEARVAAQTVDQAIGALTNEPLPAGAEHETTAQLKATVIVLLENIRRVLGPAEATLTRDAGGPSVQDLRAATGSALSALESNRSEAWIVRQLRTSGRAAIEATDRIARQQRDREHAIDEQTLAGEILLAVVIAALVLFALRLAAGVFQRQMNQHAADLYRLARSDALTGAANRHQLDDDLRFLAGTETAQVLVIDLDGFKTLNDTLGHAAGDRLLVEVTAAMQSAVGGRGTVYRTGGDEFCVLSRRPDPTLPDRVSDRLLAVAEASGVSASMGHALVPDDADDVASAISVADARMYETKASGAMRRSSDRTPDPHA